MVQSWEYNHGRGDSILTQNRTGVVAIFLATSRSNGKTLVENLTKGGFDFNDIKWGLVDLGQNQSGA